MADTRVSIRIGVDGAAEVKGALADIGKAGDEAFVKVAAGADKASAAVDKQAERYKRLAEAARASVAADQAQAGVNALLGVKPAQQGSARASAQVFEEELKSQESLAAHARALREAIDLTAAAYRRMSAAIAEADQLLAAGTVSESEHAAAVTLAKNAFQQAESGAKRLSEEMAHQAASTGLNRLQMLELAHVGRALADEMAAGVNPMRALALEGGHISQIFASSPGGVGGTLKAIGAELAGLVTPTIAVGAAIVAASATVVVALARWKEAQDALQLSLNGLGRASGFTLNELNRARRQAEADLFVPQLQSTAGQVATQASVTKLKDIDYQFVDQKLKDVNAELDNQNRLLDAQKGALGQDNSVMQGTIAAQKLLNYYLSEHIPITERLKQKIIEAGQAEAERAKREEEFARAQRRIIAELDMARDSVSNVLENVALAGAHGQSITKALWQSLTQIGDNLIRQGVGSLTEGLLGAKGTTGTGLIGGLLGALGVPGLGGASQVGQANITAGVVNLSGGLGTGAGLLGGGSSGLLGGLFDWAKGLFGFEAGGVMTSRGPLPLHHYASGGIATSPQVALFGEGRTPEAYVPLPDGRSIPVSIKMPSDALTVAQRASKLVRTEDHGVPAIMKMTAAGGRASAIGNRLPTAEDRLPPASRQPIVNLHISTPDRRSFEASEAQLTSMLTRMLGRGARYA